MPLYEFYCPTCGQVFEKSLPLNANHAEARCPSGHQNARRLFSAPPVVFKGSGFYVTDHPSSRGGTDKSEKMPTPLAHVHGKSA
jgi:putative FmdB family regulatory protein